MESSQKISIKENFDESNITNKLADYYSNLATTYLSEGTPSDALRICNKGMEYEKELPNLRWNRALSLLEMGNYEEGFNEYEYGTRMECNRESVKRERTVRDYHVGGSPDWGGEKGKIVVVYGEQGIGDEIMFASVLPDMMRDCTVILDAHPRLADIFRNSFPRMAVYGTRKNKHIPWTKFHNIDSRIAIGSIGKFYRKKESDFPKTPYLKADEQIVNHYKKVLNEMSQKPKIGISWRGGSEINNNKRARFIPLDKWKSLLSLDADFISLQYNEDAGKEVDIFTEKYGLTLHHWSDILADYDETAGLVSNLDCIISVPQSVVHLAGALGAKTYQLCPKRALWQMGPYGKNMPWYGCVENIWQTKDGEWEPVLEKAEETLCNLLQKNIGN